MNQRHLTDDRLIEICLAGSAAPQPDPHLVTCGECERRRAALTEMLAQVSEATAIEADAAFPAERLARQQARILQRVDQEGRPGRVIAVPAGHSKEPTVARTRPAARRWVAAAAAAGLFVGLLAGHYAHDLPGGGRLAVAPQIVANDAGSGVAIRAVSTTLSDDEFLGQIVAIGSAGPAALRPLDAVTPRAWDSNIR